MCAVCGVFGLGNMTYWRMLFSQANIIYARNLMVFFQLFRLEFQLKLQSKWKSSAMKKAVFHVSLGFAELCRMHISFNFTSCHYFEIVFFSAFRIFLMLMFKYFLNHTISSSHFLVTSNIQHFFPLKHCCSHTFPNYSEPQQHISVSNNQNLLCKRFIK